MSRRDEIRMSAAEARAFLGEQRTVTCATAGPRGWPHLMPLWYVLRGEDMWAWTFARSQKAVNLGRDARATLQVEDGESYDQLRGIVLECDTVLHRDEAVVADLGQELSRRYAGVDELDEGAQAAIRAQAAKRVALQFKERHRMTWDHRKLGGTY